MKILLVRLLSAGAVALLAAGLARADFVQIVYAFPPDDTTMSFTPTTPVVLDRVNDMPRVGSGETTVDSRGEIRTFFSTVPPDSTLGPFSVTAVLDDTGHFTGTGTATISLHTVGFGVLPPADPNVPLAYDTVVTSLSVSDGTPQHLARALFANQPRAGYTVPAPGVPFPIDLLVTDTLTFSGTLNVPFTIELLASGINGASLDLFHTAQLTFDLSPGVSVSTDGGFSQSASTVPEPSSFLLLATAMAGLYAWRRRKRTNLPNKKLLVAMLLSDTLLPTPFRLHANVVTDWNTIASTTIVTNGGKASVASGVWFAYAFIAVYDAVNAVHRQYQPFYYNGIAPAGASDEAAAAAAAHRVLVNYFPAQQLDLDAAFMKSLNGIIAPVQAKTDGVATGEAAAAALISERTNDALEANVPYTPGSGPGVWQPTPPGFLAALTPWLGQMRPFTLKSAAEFLPDGPTPLTGERWVAELNETRLFGDTNSTVRTAAESEIGLFWAVHTGQQYSRAFVYLAQNYKLDVMDSARLLAILWTGYADTGIACWNAKFTYNFWRPVAAIRAGGGNSEVMADAAWTSLATTPNHPEYPAAHGCVTGVSSRLVEEFFGTRRVHIVVDNNTTFSDGVHTHTFESTADWFEEVYWARILAGLHFHHSMEDGATLGTQVAAHVFENHFRRKPRQENR